MKNWEQGRNVPEIETHDKQFIHHKTGLSENAINKLLELYNNAGSQIEIWDDFLAILKEISDADSYETAVHKANAGSIEEIRQNISNIHHWAGMLARCKYEILIRFSKMIDARYGAGKKIKHYENTVKKRSLWHTPQYLLNM